MNNVVSPWLKKKNCPAVLLQITPSFCNFFLLYHQHYHTICISFHFYFPGPFLHVLDVRQFKQARNIVFINLFYQYTYLIIDEKVWNWQICELFSMHHPYSNHFINLFWNWSNINFVTQSDTSEHMENKTCHYFFLLVD